MPKHNRKRQPDRPAPYNLRGSTANMATVMPSPMGAWAPSHQQSYSWSDAAFPSYPTLTQTYMHMPPAPNHMQQHHPRQQLPQKQTPGQSVPWTNDEDTKLIDAKTQGLGWNDINLKYFPKKTANACRKRHERLMQKLRTTDWDEARVRRVTRAYSESTIREKFWKAIASQVNEERWEDVERVCFQQGLKNLRNVNTSQSRGRSRTNSGNVDYEQASSTSGDFENKAFDHDDSGFMDGLPSSRRSSHGQSHVRGHGHSQSISLPVSGVQPLSALEMMTSHQPQRVPQTTQHVSQHLNVYSR